LGNGCDAGAGGDGDAGAFVVDELALAGVDSSAYLDAEIADVVADLKCAVDRAGCGGS
jgi:hypothetical protein